MIDANTVFILGAGSSVPYGFPTGFELRKAIIYMGQELIENHFRKSLPFSNGQEEIRERTKRMAKFIDRFWKSGITSIDKFLSLNQEFIEEGKLIISILILDYEYKSRFNEEIKDSSQDWYSHIFNRLIQSINTPEYKRIIENKVSFITFNYDRSLEKYLITCLNNSFYDYYERNNRNEKTNLPFDIMHVYGSLGELKVDGNGDITNYGTLDQDEGLENIANNLNLIYEQRIDQENLKNLDEKIQEKLRNAQKIFFLGFGFAQENLDLLRLNNLSSHEKRVCGTVLGFEDREITQIKSKLARAEHQEYAKLEKIDCKSLLKKYL